MLIRTLTAGVVAAGCCQPAIGQSSYHCPPQRLRSLTMHDADHFGSALAISGEWLFVGDSGDDLLCPFPPECNSGALWVYRRDSLGAWAPTQRIVPHDLVEGDWFGYAVAADGDEVAVSATELGSFGPGTVRIYNLDGERWRQAAVINPPSPLDSAFGYTLALAGDWLAIGASSREMSPRILVVYVYRRQGGSWELAERLASPAPRERGGFGAALALNERWLAIGEPGVDHPIDVLEGRVWMYELLPGGALTAPSLLIASDDPKLDLFGTSLVFDGDALFVGAPRGPGPLLGQGVVFECGFLDGQWRLRRSIHPPYGTPTVEFGQHIAVGDGVIAATGKSGIGLYLFDAAGGEMRTHIRNLGGDLRAVATDGRQAHVGKHVFASRGAVYTWDVGCAACAPDLDGDGALTIFDYLVFGDLLFAQDPRADWNRDGTVDLRDFPAFESAFEAGCGVP